MAHWRTFLAPDARGGRYLPWKEVGRATGLSRTTAWRLQRRDDFPAPYVISPGRVGYREDEVEAWCVSRAQSPRRATPGQERSGPATDTLESGARERPIARRRPVQTPAPPNADATFPLPSPEPVARSSASDAPVRRRRSEHARAIAQQMRFDF